MSDGFTVARIMHKTVQAISRISFAEWKKIVLKVKERTDDNNVVIISAGVGFFGFLAIFPAIMALISIYGFVMDPQQIEDQVSKISSVMPEQTHEILQYRVDNFIKPEGKPLGWGTFFGILLGIWIGNLGTKSLFRGINIAYGTESRRGIIKNNGLTLLFTFGAIILIILSAALIVAFPAIIEKIGLPDHIVSLTSWLRWLVMGVVLVGSISLIYYFGPKRSRPGFMWCIPGAVLASSLWLLASWAFSFYIRNFWNLGEIYGSISAVIFLMLWLFISTFIVLLGAELNYEIERQAMQESGQK
ncbi:YihY/virulence factor BrkB family protein [Algoriphagus halophytocola]|uniref:YihY/virulence factor BrkB family protein n=1 Tax=Algoriphagus halophytocola TaxID=2991499 RepID=A0ABY6MGE0_9BACT|nr:MULTISPECIES: YihY/virulence factor BrkB family protein [unclassified Algoriphagus]UZD22875.1 YihY/virulence factor BrkB family protein [Algoriphagus sp. TR-M5]WBL44142.1 YihY/virulence factor BrkB family protein [Algoriphagus sp. TR-M9]